MSVIVLTEVLAYVVGTIYHTNPYVVFHFSLPVYGTMLMYFFYHLVTKNSVKKTLMLLSIGYVIASLSLTFFFYQITDFPGFSLNLLGVLLILVSIYVLFTLEPIHDIPIYKHPAAWVCLGIVVFFSGNFFLNGIYNYLVETKSNSTGLIHQIINHGLNCFMYSCFIVGLICSHQLRKYRQLT